ncbi:acetyl- propionyl-coenzyme A carboxylase alpha chain [Fusarium acutatum]|uniref:Acetyl- propionyl-coenzyme A carboxylase alpha chain n=1 Tax=Fusarium acutatum TaxID=78861 RepID=A0A8H4JTD6_9HYPO|nr:acetyl- propionyl-coenzyme A carboxylase alpha chain [Fusarium acutatum]
MLISWSRTHSTYPFTLQIATMTAIQDLPNELILMTVAEVPLSTFAALRQTCRRFNEVTIVTFGKRFFHTRNIMLHEKSVQNLVSIANHLVFASCVRKVGFAPSFVRGNWLGFEEECEARLNFGIEKITFENMQDIPQRLPSTIFILAAVDQAFERLPNCNTISLTNAQRPWGLSKIKEVKDYCEIQELKGQWFIRYLIGYIFTLSIKFGMENVEIFADKDCHKPLEWLRCRTCSSIGIYDVCMARPASVSNLKSLKMTVHARPRAWPNGAFAQLLSCFPQLSSLTLDFDETTDHSLYFSNFKIPGLKELTLSCSYCHPSELVNVIKRHEETLERAAFHDVLLTDLPGWLLLMDVLCQMPKIHVYIDWLAANSRIWWDGCIGHRAKQPKLHPLAWELYKISDLENDNDKRRMRDLLHRINDWVVSPRKA